MRGCSSVSLKLLGLDDVQCDKDWAERWRWSKIIIDTPTDCQAEVGAISIYYRASPSQLRLSATILSHKGTYTTTMHATKALRQWACRITLFTRENCSLCSDAKQVLSQVWDKRPFEYDEVDVMAPSQTKWKGLYEFDTPVVNINLLLHG